MTKDEIETLIASRVSAAVVEDALERWLYRRINAIRTRRAHRVHGHCPSCGGLLTRQARGLWRCDACRRKKDDDQ